MSEYAVRVTIQVERAPSGYPPEECLELTWTELVLADTPSHAAESAAFQAEAKANGLLR